jgi:hypothetical protein
MTNPEARQLTEHSRFVYDARTGQIVHTYHLGAPAGVPLPSEEEIDARAIEEAARLTNRPLDALGSLSFDRNSIKAGIHYSVDVDERRLVEAEGRGGAPVPGMLRGG